MLAYTYIKKYNLRFLKSLGSQLQVYRHPKFQSIPLIDTRGGGRFTFSQQNHIVEFFILNTLIRYNFAVHFIMGKRTWQQLNG
jgi:hypothetical protein